MPRFAKESDGRTITVETSAPRESAQLRAEGFIEQNAEAAPMDEGGSLQSGLSVVTNDAGRAEALKPSPKPTK